MATKEICPKCNNEFNFTWKIKNTRKIKTYPESHFCKACYEHVRSRNISNSLKKYYNDDINIAKHANIMKNFCANINSDKRTKINNNISKSLRSRTREQVEDAIEKARQTHERLYGTRSIGHGELASIKRQNTISKRNTNNKIEHITKTRREINENIRLGHANRTPEDKAKTSKQIIKSKSCKKDEINENIRLGHANRTPEDKAKTSMKHKAIRKNKTIDEIHAWNSSISNKLRSRTRQQRLYTRTKTRDTSIKRYGTNHYIQSDIGKELYTNAIFAKYGVTHVSQVPEIRAKQIRNARKSKPELKLLELLNKHINITKYTIQHQYTQRNNNITHTFDFAIFDSIQCDVPVLLIDVDGLYFHAYLSDHDGKRCRSDYDAIRVLAKPNENIPFIVVHEDNIDESIQYILDTLNQPIINYINRLRKWVECMINTNKLYPNYADKLIAKSKANLVNYDSFYPGSSIGLKWWISNNLEIYKSSIEFLGNNMEEILPYIYVNEREPWRIIDIVWTLYPHIKPTFPTQEELVYYVIHES